MRKPRGPARGRIRTVRNPATGCLLWQFAKDPNGYGVATVPGTGRKIHAHRLAWIEAHGPIPLGLYVLHKCDVRHCIEPEHLFLGTAADNAADMVAKGRQAYGELNGNARLSDIAAAAIRQSREKGVVLAVRFRVSPTLVSLIRTGQVRKHL